MCALCSSAVWPPTNAKKNHHPTMKESKGALSSFPCLPPRTLNLLSEEEQQTEVVPPPEICLRGNKRQRKHRVLLCNALYTLGKEEGEGGERSRQGQLVKSEQTWWWWWYTVGRRREGRNMMYRFTPRPLAVGGETEPPKNVLSRVSCKQTRLSGNNYDAKKPISTPSIVNSKF